MTICDTVRSVYCTLVFVCGCLNAAAPLNEELSALAAQYRVTTYVLGPAKSPYHGIWRSHRGAERYEGIDDTFVQLFHPRAFGVIGSSPAIQSNLEQQRVL